MSHTLEVGWLHYAPTLWSCAAEVARLCTIALVRQLFSCAGCTVTFVVSGCGCYYFVSHTLEVGWLHYAPTL
eukprot:COSAG04_NODE_9524_length_855_cov_1.784392_1_plen_71_part_10